MPDLEQVIRNRLKETFRKWNSNANHDYSHPVFIVETYKVLRPLQLATYLRQPFSPLKIDEEIVHLSVPDVILPLKINYLPFQADGAVHNYNPDIQIFDSKSISIIDDLKLRGHEFKPKSTMIIEEYNTEDRLADLPAFLELNSTIFQHLRFHNINFLSVCRSSEIQPTFMRAHLNGED